MSQIHPLTTSLPRGTAIPGRALQSPKKWRRRARRHFDYIVLPGCAEPEPLSADFAGGPAVGAASYLDAHFA